MNRSAFNAVAFNSPQHERGLTWSATTSDAVNLQDVTFGSVAIGILGEFKFGENRLAGAGYPLGTLNVECVYFVEGAAQSQNGTVQIVPSGNAVGSMISIFCHTRPEAKYILAQTTSGALVQGRNPTLPT